MTQNQDILFGDEADWSPFKAMQATGHQTPAWLAFCTNNFPAIEVYACDNGFPMRLTLHDSAEKEPDLFDFVSTVNGNRIFITVLSPQANVSFLTI